MKSEFIRTMKHLWPEGIDDNIYQFRDRVRTYTVGWFDALRVCGNKVVARQDEEILVMQLDPNWMPDDSWKWW